MISITSLLLIVLEHVCLYYPLVLGAYISISLMKLPDLSIESASVCGAIIATKFLTNTSIENTFLLLMGVLGASLLGGALVGCTSSMLREYGKIPHLLTSILTMGLFYGVNFYLLGTSNQSLSSLPNPFTNERLIVIIIFFALLCLSILFFKTHLGYALAVFGNNPLFFSHHQTSTRYIVSTGLIVSSALAGLSGYCVAQVSGFVDVLSGTGMALFCITSIMLGKLCVPTNKPLSFLVPLVGVALYCTLQQLLLIVGFDLKYFTTIQAGVVLCILIYKFRNQDRSIDSLGV